MHCRVWVAWFNFTIDTIDAILAFNIAIPYGMYVYNHLLSKRHKQAAIDTQTHLPGLCFFPVIIFL